MSWTGHKRTSWSLRVSGKSSPDHSVSYVGIFAGFYEAEPKGGSQGAELWGWSRHGVQTLARPEIRSLPAVCFNVSSSETVSFLKRQF